MAKLMFGMNQSLDGYVDHTAFAPGESLFRHFINQTQGLAGSLYGRKLYEIMSYWDEEQDGWGAAEHEFAQAWRQNRKWVASRTLTTVGPNATLLGSDLEAEIRRLKTDVEGDIEVGGPDLAPSLADLGLIDEYKIYLHPVVTGKGTPFFAAPDRGYVLLDTRLSKTTSSCSPMFPPRRKHHAAGSVHPGRGERGRTRGGSCLGRQLAGAPRR